MAVADPVAPIIGVKKMTVLVGESGAMSIINAINAAGFVIVSNDALKAGSDGYG